MKIKITQQFLLLGIFLVSTLGFAQITITDVFPTRVTTTSTITIIGTNFTPSTAISINGISTSNKVFVSSTEMTIEVSRTDTSVSNKILTVGGVQASELINYVGPVVKNLYKDKSYFINEIYTNWNYNGNGFWRSNDWVVAGKPNTGASCPDDFHELLGYKMNSGVIYSTGVDDELLEDKLVEFGIRTQVEIDNEENYQKKIFKAYSTNGVQGKTNSANFILAGDQLDNRLVGSAENATNGSASNVLEVFDNINSLTIFDVIIDGINGLELGTGISNFNNNTDVRFYSGDGQPGAISDALAPDLLISQIAKAGASDIYYYADNLGNVVGWPVKVGIPERSDTILAKWRLDLYSFPGNQDFTTANPSRRAYGNNEYRPLRMLAFTLEDFGISNSTDVEMIENINMTAGGTADIAFMAYNKAAFDIKVPVSSPLLTQYVCKVDGTSTVTFSTNAGVEDASGNIVDPTTSDLELTYEWLKNNVPLSPAQNGSSLVVTNVQEEDLGTYKVKIQNSKGTIIMPVDLSQGGTPYIWNGTSWSSPYGAVSEEERSLVFVSDYNESGDLEGCDCQVASGVNVTIPEGKSMKLYGAITVDPEILEETEVIDGETVIVVPHIPAGTFTLENNASLIQTKQVTSNENSGEIKVKRTATELGANDYLYWSSPVDNFNLSEIPGSNGYLWDVNYDNPNGTEGNWVAHSGVMTPGSGYIKRVPSAADLTVGFEGVPTNGEITIPAYKSTLTDDLTGGGDWNLIGNPYPSSLRAFTFLQANEDLGGAVYLWNQKVAASNTADNPFYDNYAVNYGDQYVTYNGTGSTPDTDYAGNIASGQGFFIQVQSADSSPTTVTFSNDMRYDASEEAYDNSQFYRPDETNTVVGEVQKELIWLSLVNEANSSAVALVGYVEGATNDNDRMYDAVANGEGMRMYSVLGASKMVIQGRSLPFNETDTVPLGVDIPENGIYRIGLQDVSGEQFTNNEQAIYLEDTYTNTIHDLRESPYSFTGVEGSVLDRFVLRYTTSSLSVETYESNDTFVYVKDQQFYLKATENIKSIELYDITGKQLPAYDVSSNSNTYTGAFQYPRGVYVVIIKFTDNSVVSKKIIN